MNSTSSIVIDAPAPVVWDVFVDTGRWHEWTASITSITPLDGPAIEVGNRFRIKQPRFPALVWQVTQVDPGRGWTWVQRSPGGTTAAIHHVRGEGGRRTVVEQRIDQRGPVGTLVGLLTRGLTRRYLELEGQGLKRRSEQRAATA